ncbi:MAG: type II toxin-antitoxin system VapC family toxin [Vicinamibacterales bacterium]
MILVDTSVWIEHLRTAKSGLEAALDDGEVLMHPLVFGELACGNIANRRVFLDLMHDLPLAQEASHEEAMTLIEKRRLMGRGIGYIDVQLLAATAITPLARFWTFDRRLAKIAAELGIGV